jgi:hypothetical protein
MADWDNMTDDEIREDNLGRILAGIVYKYPILDPSGDTEKEEAFREALGAVTDGSYFSGFNDGILNVLTIVGELVGEEDYAKVTDELEKRYGWDASDDLEEDDLEADDLEEDDLEEDVETSEAELKDLLIKLAKKDLGELN